MRPFVFDGGKEVAFLEVGVDGVYGFFIFETSHGRSDDRETSVVWGVGSQTGFCYGKEIIGEMK